MNLESSSNNNEQQKQDLNKLLSELSQIKEQLPDRQHNNADKKITELEQRINKVIPELENNSERLFTGMQIEEIKKDVEIKEIYTHQDEKLAKLRERIIAAKVQNSTPQGQEYQLDPRFTESEVIADFQTPINTVITQAEQGIITGPVSNRLKKLGIEDSNKTVA